MTDREFEVWLAEQAAEAASFADEAARVADQARSASEARSEAVQAPPTKLETEAIFNESTATVAAISMKTASPTRKRKRTTKPSSSKDDAPLKKDITLLPTQLQHFERVQAMHKRFPFALDLSMLGAGKTYTSAKLAQTENYKHVIVVCPVSVIPKWKHMKHEFGIPVRDIISFQSLRSTKCTQPKHGLLHRRDYKQVVQVPHSWIPNQFTTQELDKVEFTPSDTYRTMIDEGLLLVVDEIQNIKNISSQFLAAQALIHAITLKEGPLVQACNLKKGIFDNVFGTSKPVTFKSHVLLLSGSPIDKQEHAMHLFRAIGVMTDERVIQYNIQTRQNDWRGLQQIYDFCYGLDSKGTTAVAQKYNWEQTYEPYVYRLFQQLFKKHCSSFMMPPNPGTKLEKRNAYYVIDKEGAEIVHRGLHGLKGITNFDGNRVHFVQGATMQDRTRQMAGITRCMQILETGKIQMLARIAEDALTEQSNCKVVIAVNYSDTVTDLKDLLAEYNPLILTGSTTEQQRGKLLEQFQAPNVEHRLLICNQSVASTGIDLDDKHGAFPRLCLVSPNFSTITSYQLGHRFQRADSKSDARVHFVFAKKKGKTKKESEEIIELKVLDALSRKSQVMRETTEEQSKAGVIFPGDHQEWDEEHGDLGSVHITAKPKKIVTSNEEQRLARLRSRLGEQRYEQLVQRMRNVNLE